MGHSRGQLYECGIPSSAEFYVHLFICFYGTLKITELGGNDLLAWWRWYSMVSEMLSLYGCAHVVP